MALRISRVENEAALKDFIDLPKELYKDHPGYIAPLDMERREAFGKKTNPYFQHAEAALFLARNENGIVGRVSAQICDLYRAKYGQEIGHFGFLDAVPDLSVVSQLIKIAEDWLTSRGVKTILGPFHFSTNEEIGLMIEGFQEQSMMMMPYHPPYLSAMLEKTGYQKIKDVIAYDLATINYKPLGNRWVQKAAKDARISIRPINMQHFEADLRLMLDIFNDAWSENWAMIPFTPEEVKAAVKALKPLIAPPFFKIAEIDGEPAAMIICLPNIQEAIRDLNGQLLPLGWLKLLWRLKRRKIKSARIPLMGIRKQFHGTPAASAMLALMFDSLVPPAKEWGFSHIELSWILEDNFPMRRVIEAVGGKPYKTYRLYQKELS